MKKNNRKMIESSLVTLASGSSLAAKDSRVLFEQLFRGDISEEDSRALLLLLSKKGETADELYGCLSALRKLEPPYQTSMRNLMDTCGTGGDGSSSINVSTLTAFIVAGAGGKVAKHGNKAISSKSGSSDILRKLGVNIDAPRSVMIKSIVANGIGYFHAPHYHPVFAKVQPLRQKMKTRTVFNLLGPLVNPFTLKRQLIGVSKKKYVKMFAEVLSRRSMRRALVCHSRDGMDEVSASVETDAVVVEGEKLKTLTISPSRYGFKQVAVKKYSISSLEKIKDTTMALLKGDLKKGPLRNIIVINGAAGIFVSGLAGNIDRGIEMARSSLDDGLAYRAFVGLKECSNGN